MTATGGAGRLRDAGGAVLWSVGVSALAAFALIAAGLFLLFAA